MANVTETKTERYLAYLAGDADSYPDNPETKVERYLYYLCANGMSGGSVSPEDIQEAVNEYMKENPISTEAIESAINTYLEENPVGELQVRDHILTISGGESDEGA